MTITPFVMVLIRCPQIGPQCETTMPVAYESQATCMAARPEILIALGDRRVAAECRPQGGPKAMELRASSAS